MENRIKEIKDKLNDDYIEKLANICTFNFNKLKNKKELIEFLWLENEENILEKINELKNFYYSNKNIDDFYELKEILLKIQEMEKNYNKSNFFNISTYIYNPLNFLIIFTYEFYLTIPQKQFRELKKINKYLITKRYTLYDDV